jgi:putative ATP-binding cassette transporter
MPRFIHEHLGPIWRLGSPYFWSRDKISVRLGPFGTWSGIECWVGRGLLAAIIGIELAQVFLAVLLNQWNARFYNALQSKDLTSFWHQLIVFSIIAAIFIVIAVYQLYLNQWLQIRWRRWMTSHYIRLWLDQGAHYRMRLLRNLADNPDQRIADDIAFFIHLTLTLGLGLLSAATTLASFGVILWGISTRVPLTLEGYTLSAPGYLVWTAAAFSFLATLGAHVIGRPLIGLDFERQRFEADFRFALVRLRENSEQIALLQGESTEQSLLANRFANIIDNWHRIMSRQKTLTFFTAGYNQAAVVLPYIIMAPHFFAGTILLGTLTRTAGAFGQVQSAFSFFVNAYARLADWIAVSHRLSGFETQAARARTGFPAGGVRYERTPSDVPLRLIDVSIATPGGKPLVECLSVALNAGESLLFTGPSGSGKTTLLRAICGVWPYSDGQVVLGRQAHLLALPQQPYLPLGSLRAALAYPAREGTIPDRRLRDILAKVGLATLDEGLDETAPWSEILSPGEQQRISFARALLERPSILLLDEATSALDEESATTLFCLLRSELPDVAILSIGHRLSLLRLHDRSIDFRALLAQSGRRLARVAASP